MPLQIRRIEELNKVCYLRQTSRHSDKLQQTSVKLIDLFDLDAEWKCRSEGDVLFSTKRHPSLVISLG